MRQSDQVGCHDHDPSAFAVIEGKGLRVQIRVHRLGLMRSRSVSGEPHRNRRRNLHSTHARAKLRSRVQPRDREKNYQKRLHHARAISAECFLILRTASAI